MLKVLSFSLVFFFSLSLRAETHPFHRIDDWKNVTLKDIKRAVKEDRKVNPYDRKGASDLCRNIHTESPIEKAAKYNPHPDVFIALIKEYEEKCYHWGGRPRMGEDVLAIASQFNNPAVVQTLITETGAANCTYKSIEAAIRNPNPDVIKILIKNGAPPFIPSTEINDILNPKILNILIKEFKKKNDLHYTNDVEEYQYKIKVAFFTAVEGNKNPEIISILLKAGAKVNMKDGGGKTPLMYAAMYNPGIINVLLKAGAKVNINDNDGRTPLMYAAMSGTPEGIEKLLKAGAKVNIEDNNGKTALMHVISTGDGEGFDLLLDAGAKINIKDEDGKTPLMYAIELRWDSAVERLLKEGADVKVINEDGDSAYDISRKKSAVFEVCRSSLDFKMVCLELGEEKKSAEFAAFKETPVYWKISDLFFQDEFVQ